MSRRKGESDTLASDIITSTTFRSRFLRSQEEKPERKPLEVFFSDSGSDGIVTPKSGKPATRQPVTVTESQGPVLKKTSAARRQHSVSSSRRMVSEDGAAVKDRDVTPKVRRRVSAERSKISDGVENPRPRKLRSASVQRARPRTQQVAAPVLITTPEVPHKPKLSVANEVSLTYYFIEERPQPFIGERVALLNDQTLEVVFPQEEEKQYVQRVSPPSQPKTDSTNANSPVDKILMTMFLDGDDAGIEFFEMDFAKAYVTDQEPVRWTFEGKTYIPSIAVLAEKLADAHSMSQVLSTVFGEKIEGEPASLTGMREPSERDVDIKRNLNGETVLDAISPAAFFDFRMGKSVIDSSVDRLHVFTWHNLGIPGSQVARDLGALIKSGNGQVFLEGAVQYLFTWLYCFPTDFYNDPHLVDVLVQLLKLIVEKDKTLLRRASIIKSLAVVLQEKKYSPDEWSYRLQAPVISISSEPWDLMSLSVEPSVLAVHFTYLELKLLHKLQRGEFVCAKWAEYPRYLKAVINRFNETVSFIASSILVENQSKRAKNIQYWIRVMKEAKKLRNFQLIAEIDAALSSLPISRLKATWKSLKTSVVTQFQGLHNLSEQKTYWEDVFSVPRKTTPFIGMFLTELARLSKAAPKKQMASGSDGYDMNMQRKTLSIVECIFADWGLDLRFELDSRILEECNVLSGKARRPEELILPSVHCEPVRSNEKRFIEKFVQGPAKK